MNMNKQQTQAPARQNATVAKKGQPDIEALLKGQNFRSVLLPLLGGERSVNRFIGIATLELKKNPLLAKSTQTSFFNCIRQCAAMGIEPDGQKAFLIPYRDNRSGTVECTLQIGYKGYVALAMRTGLPATIHADIVCENDEFEYNLGEITKHKIDFRNPRGDMYAAYALVRNKDGSAKYEVMSKEEVDGIKARSKARSGPWHTDYNEMAKKTAFRRLAKWISLDSDLLDNAQRAEDGEKVLLGDAEELLSTDDMIDVEAVEIEETDQVTDDQQAVVEQANVTYFEDEEQIEL